MEPENYVAFASDRICKKCGTRYTPPTPRWAGVLFLICGLFLIAVAGYFVIDFVNIAKEHDKLTRRRLFAPVLYCGIPGIAALWYGVKKVMFPDA